MFLSKTIISVSLPAARRPLLSFNIFEGTTVSILIVSGKPMPTFSVMKRTILSQVAMLPAKALLSASLQTPSSMMNSVEFIKPCVIFSPDVPYPPAGARLSVTSAILSLPFIFKVSCTSSAGTCLPSAMISTYKSSFKKAVSITPSLRKPFSLVIVEVQEYKCVISLQPFSIALCISS